MGAEERQNGQGGCIAIRSFPPPSISRCTIGGSSTTTSDDATCGSPRWIGKSLSCVCIKRKGNYERICMTLTPLQNERLQRLKQRMKVYFDSSRRDHQEALKALWHATYPDQELEGLISDQWKAMGWQGRDPSTDFRGAGFISLENLLFFAKTFSTSFQRLLNKQGGKRATWEYPFAVAGLSREPLLEPFLFKCSQRMNGHLIYFIALPSWYWINNGLKRMPPTWISIALVQSLQAQINTKGGKDVSDTTYQEVLRSTRVQLERELLLDDVMRIEDMPSYSNLS